MNSTSKREHELVDLIYAALLGESSWSTFMERLVDQPGDGWTAFVSHDARLGEGMLGHYFGCDNALVHDYEGHFAAVNPWAPQCVAKAAGRAVTGNELVARDRFVKTEFYNDFFRAYDTQDGSGITIVKERDRSMMLSIMTPDADPSANARMAETLAYLYPHLRRAADYYRRERDGAGSLGFGSNLLNAIDVGAVVVGQDSRPKSVSESAAEMIASSRGLEITSVGRFRILNEDADEALVRMLAYNYAGPQSENFTLADAKVTLVRMNKDRISWYFEGPTVVVLIEPLSRMEKRFDPDWFVETFGLSRAELRALIGIMDGKSPAAIAAEAGISRETIRTQIKSLYLKTGVNSQAGLLRLIHSPLSSRLG